MVDSSEPGTWPPTSRLPVELNNKWRRVARYTSFYFSFHAFPLHGRLHVGPTFDRRSHAIHSAAKWPATRAHREDTLAKSRHSLALSNQLITKSRDRGAIPPPCTIFARCMLEATSRRPCSSREAGPLVCKDFGARVLAVRELGIFFIKVIKRWVFQ